jgi:hypothetical protein
LANAIRDIRNEYDQLVSFLWIWNS